MSTTMGVDPGAAPAPACPSIWERTLRVYTRPFQAWDGLEDRVQFWFPLLVTLLLTVACGLFTYHRAILPMIDEQQAQMVEAGKATQAQVDQIYRVYEGTAGMAMVVGSQAVGVLVMVLLIALVVWFGVGFVLGGKLSYRLALESVTWASLVSAPEMILRSGWAYAVGTMKGVHVSLAVLLPVSDPPSKWGIGLAVLLDAVGPFGIWYLFVVIVGCAALARAPRKNVAWVLSALYLGIMAVFALVAGMLSPGS